MKFARKNKPKEKAADYGLKGFWNPKGQSSPVSIVSPAVVKEKKAELLCRHCSKPIKFIRNDAGKFVPVNLDGSAHSDQWSPLRPVKIDRLPTPRR